MSRATRFVASAALKGRRHATNPAPDRAHNVMPGNHLLAPRRARRRTRLYGIALGYIILIQAPPPRQSGTLPFSPTARPVSVTQPAAVQATERACLIANPVAGRGRARRLLPVARRAFAELVRGDVRLTLRPGDEERLTREAIAGECTTIAVLGGDGTWSKVAGALVDAGSHCRLLPLAAGTGNDFPKTLGLPTDDFAAMARIAASGGSRAIDVGSVEGRVFVNSVGFGFDVAALEVAARTPWLGGNALYAYAALNLLFRYRGVYAELLDDPPGDTPPVFQHLLTLVLANGPRFGGSFVIAPDAQLADGRLDAVTIRDASALRRIGLLAAVKRGRHTRGHAGVEARPLARAWARFPEAPLYEVDGELVRARSAMLEIRCLPAALRVATPA